MNIFWFKLTAVQTYFPENSGLTTSLQTDFLLKPFFIEILKHCFFFFFLLLTALQWLTLHLE